MRAGQLRHKVILQSPPDPNSSANADTFGQVQNIDGTKWSDIGTYRAFIRPMTAREIAIASEQRGDVTHQAKMRYVGEIKPTYRLVFHDVALNRDRILNVAEVLNIDERKREYTLTLREVKTP